MKNVIIEFFNPLLIVVVILTGAGIIRQILKIRKEQPQDHYALRLLLMELWLLIVSAIAFLQKDISIFFSLYFD
ncbi:MAG: hypothetical protein HFH68_05280 [Lachnospiraceae bacterium]|nr:hypothetical protein [Lachnospiraceae bacterium]